MNASSVESAISSSLDDGDDGKVGFVKDDRLDWSWGGADGWWKIGRGGCVDVSAGRTVTG